ncbi:type II toxin-antitoxin system VapC family toxin [Mucilaginibacter phyllosphaerae]|uniref:Type II toxin-antitoxin system VapC family toxin n=1 Tax=Mucilaginibacter phyllosphaerae TaxID=1812349 RepID=A0A4Y8AGQ0_9SPHI|nr:type II toxin-antitoxin system VapC family toxin [Mucilaginibacter phyllosphaerae]MBB3968438.1 hypothetical protein [Mucilaginibacter phyllosphaerae]TEW67914.1 type II toxin-antitoxin system VapC family toxin [Mucilaginibacter phyllosphaerae]GGH16005.1 hypothetical protein GCM10007352_25120 [Mucilaginibacter phyllosphaerae]
MSGKEILIDTNIVIYLLRGSQELQDYLQGKELYISFISELELLGYKSITQKHEAELLNFLNDCSIIQMSNAIKENYIGLTRKYKIELPDALIAATSLTLNIPFITADKGFQKINDINLVLYHDGINLTASKK